MSQSKTRSRNNRETLQMAVSNDRGLNWIRIYTLENSPDQEFSYPYGEQ